MEHWKRRQMRLNYEWDLTGFEDEEVSIDEKAGKKKLKSYFTAATRNVLKILDIFCVNICNIPEKLLMSSQCLNQVCPVNIM